MKQGRGCFVRRRLVIGTRPYNYIKLFPLFVITRGENWNRFSAQNVWIVFMMLAVVENNCCRNKVNKGWGKEEQFPYNGSLWCVVTGPGAADCPNTSIKDLHKRGIHVSNICCPVMVLYALIYCISADGHHQEHIFWHTSRPCRHVTVFTSNVQNVCFVSFLVNVFEFPFSQQTSVKHPVFPEAVSAWAEDICCFTIIFMPLDGYTQ